MSRPPRVLVAASSVLLLVLSTSLTLAVTAAPPAQLHYEVLIKQPHDTRLFTQGLVLQEKALVESAGGYGRSLVRRYDAASGTLYNQVRLPKNQFAEGIAQAQEELVVLTWRAGVAYRLDAKTLQQKGQYRYEGEGWGLTFGGEQFIMSNGSDTLTFRAADSFAPLRELRVHSDGEFVDNLNELEYADGAIWANVWQENHILAIDPFSGKVTGIVDLTALVRENSSRPGHTVLNGIAYDASRDAFWVTGKLWPHRYLIRIKPSAPTEPDVTVEHPSRGME